MTRIFLSRALKLSAFVLAVVFLFPILFSSFDEPEDTQSNEKTLEIKQSLISGYSNGTLSWKVHADYIWTTKSKYLFQADKLLSGFIFDSNGQLVIDGIRAQDLRINTRSKSVAVYKSVEASLVQRATNKSNELHASSDDKRIKIKSDQLRYSSDAKKTQLSENVELTKDAFSIRPRKGVEIDNDKNVAYIDYGFTIASDQYNVTGNQLTIYIDDDYSEMEGDLVFERKAVVDTTADEREQELKRKPSFLYADSAIYKEVEGLHYLEVSDNVTLIQEGKEIKGDFGVYSQEADRFELQGNIEIQLDNLDWMIKKESADELKNEDIKSSLNAKTTIYCKRLIFDGNSNETKLIGDVVIIQEQQVIHCDKVVFVDNSSEIECHGNVKVERNEKDTLSCALLVINIEKEQFLAKDKVYSEFIIKKRGENNAD